MAAYNIFGFQVMCTESHAHINIFFFFFFFGIQVYCPGYSHETDADISTGAEGYYEHQGREAII